MEVWVWLGIVLVVLVVLLVVKLTRHTPGQG